MSRVEQSILLLTYRVVRQWWIIQNLQKPAENLGKPAAEVSGRFPAGFRIIHHWRTTWYIITLGKDFLIDGRRSLIWEILLGD